MRPGKITLKSFAKPVYPVHAGLKRGQSFVPACGSRSRYHYVELDEKDWPVTCAKCKVATRRPAVPRAVPDKSVHKVGEHCMVDKIAANNIWLTPDEPELAAVRACSFDGTIGLDPCTEPGNPTKARHFFTVEHDGLSRSWEGYGLVFVNPPYSRTTEQKKAGLPPPIRAWAKKIGDEARQGTPILALLPCGARFSTQYWQHNILRNPTLNAVCFREGRVHFIHGVTGEVGSDNNYDSVFYGFNLNRNVFADAFFDLGAVWDVHVRA